MATNQGHPSEMASSYVDVSKPGDVKKSTHEDDFVILEDFDNVTDSNISSASTIPEKDTFESLEKGSAGGSLGASTINQKPYYDDSRFIQQQQMLEKKRDFFGKGGDEREEEKSDDLLGEKATVEDLPVLSKEKNGDGDVVEGEEPKGRFKGLSSKADDKKHVSKVGQTPLEKHTNLEAGGVDELDGREAKPSHVKSGENTGTGQSKLTEHSMPTVLDDRGGATQPKDSDVHETDSDEKNLTDVSKEQLPEDHTHPPDDEKHGDLANGGLSKSQEIDDIPSVSQPERTGYEDIEVPRIAKSQTTHRSEDETAGLGEMSKGLESDQSEKESPSLEDGKHEVCSEEERLAGFQEEQDSGFSQSLTPESGPSLRRRVPHGTSEPSSNETEQLVQPPERADQVEEVPANNRRGFVVFVVSMLRGLLPVSLPLIVALIAYFRPATIRSPVKPIIEILAKKHLSPLATSWQLEATCLSYNSTYVITECQWKQIHPIPTNPENTVIPEDGVNCRTATRSHHIDATLSGLKVPKELGNYIFALRCVDNTKHSNEKRVDILVNEIFPPIITLKDGQHSIIASTSSDTLQLPKASCRAVQGVVVTGKWEFTLGPKTIENISQNGTISIDTPGKYEFQYRCIDSYDAKSLSRVKVSVKPPYVLGIDLGTSTSCVVVIRENGTQEDIAILDKDLPVHDTDPCMPSVVAFGRNGELLVGEQALHQAVINPLSTIYEVKRLMGRSYYDDESHKFSYRVRPTLKSHSLKGVRAAVEIPCKGGKKLLQPELVSALILRRVVDYAEKYLGVPVKDVVISVPAQFDDAQRKATLDAGLIAGLNPIKIVNEPTVAAFAANNLTENLLDPNHGGNAAVKTANDVVWAVVADIGGGTTDYALMQVSLGISYKVITTDGNKTLGGRDIDIQLARKLTEVFQKNHPGLDLEKTTFQQKLRIECEKAKIVLSKREQYSLTVDYTEDEQKDSLPLEYLLTRDAFESYISEILEAMVTPLTSLLARGRVNAGSIEDLYLVGGTSNIPKLKELLKNEFSNVRNIRHKDPVQLVSRGAAAFGAALTGLVEVNKMKLIVDAIPLSISIAVDMDKMFVVFARNDLYPCIQYPELTTFTNNQTAIVIKVYEGEGRTPDECHFLGEFELSGITPLPKGVPKIKTKFRIDKNGVLSVSATHGDLVKKMTLGVYSKSGGMILKTREKLSLLRTSLTSSPNSKNQFKCLLLDTATEMNVIPPKPKKTNVLKLSVDSQYDSVEVENATKPGASLEAVGMVAVKGLVTDYESSKKEADLDIVLVIDKSGSMAGIPMETIKKVILHLIDRLKSYHRLGIVSYDTHVHHNFPLVGCTEENKVMARPVITNMYAKGGTNLYGGLSEGLQMAYHGGRRSRVLLFTDGYANDGWWTDADDIIREIVKETAALKSYTSEQVQLSTFGYLGSHDEFLLQQLATSVGGGTYNYLHENEVLAQKFAAVLSDAINIVAEKILLTVTPLNGVRILKAITDVSFTENSENSVENSGNWAFEIPSTADQQSRHILLQLAVPSSKEVKLHDALFRVELFYMNTITEREEGSEEYLFVARTQVLDGETRSRDVDEQLNRVFVAEMIRKALEYLKQGNTQEALDRLREADRFVLNSISKEHTLSLCLRHDLDILIREAEYGDLNNAKKSFQDSLTSHWEEKGGKSLCYVTRKENKLISIFES